MTLRQAGFLGLASVCMLAGMQAVAETLPVMAIENARIVTVSGNVIERGTVVVREGLIEAVGADVKAPADAWILRGEGLTVYPGLIDGLSTWGLPGMQPEGGAGGARRGGGAPTPGQPGQQPPQRAWGPEDRPSNTSYLLAADELSPTDRRLEAARNAGFTGAVSFPNKNIFGGQGAVINLAGERAGNMVVASPAGLYVTMRSSGFGGGFPGSIMGVIAYIRQIYLDADYYKMAKAAYEANPRGLKRPDYDKTLEGVLMAPRVLLPAADRKEIDRMIRFAGELKMPKPVLYGGHGAYRATDLLKGKDIPVLVNLQWPEKRRDADPEDDEPLRVLELRDKAPSTPAELEKAGIKYAFYSGAIERPADIRRAVKRALDAGLTREQAVRAMTLSVAEIYGVADRIGSIEKGKIANLTVMKGDLFDDKSEVKYVVIDGAKFEPAPEAPARGGEVTR